MKMYKLLCILCSFLLIQTVIGKTLEEELILSHKQKIKLNQLRQLVAHRVPHPYMSEDWQLVKWLKVTKFDVPTAEKRIMETVKWRADNKMDTILEEDWSDFQSAEYRVSVEGCKDGRPLISIDVGDWPLREIVLAGKRVRFLRFTDKLSEQATVLVRTLRGLGHNVTQIVDFYDFGHFNSMEHLCFQCLTIYAYIAENSEKHYPLLPHKSIMTNVPPSYLTIHPILLGFASEETKAGVVLYGRNNKDWKERLRKEFGQDNLSKQFGGVKEDIWEIEDVIKDPSLFKCST